MTGIQVAWEDVFSVIDMIKPQLILIGLGLIACIAVLIGAVKAQKPRRGFIRKQSVIAFILFLTIIVNNICLGTLNNTLAMVFAEAGVLQETTKAESRNTVQKLAEEGIVMLKNDDGALPLNNTTNLNVFGWASINPIYGGTGSGSVDVSTAVDILSGLENAGFVLNKDLSDMYKDYRKDRPEITINNGQDWTLPEVPAAQYSDEMISRAKAFSDTALIVLARCGGEGADLPHDMGAVMDGSWQTAGTKYMKASYTNNSDQYADFTDGMNYLELSRTEQDMVNLVCANFDNVIVVYNGANPLEMGWVNDHKQIKGLLVCPGAGSTGFNGLATILHGEVNPSGKTADTWVYDLTATPYYNNIGNFTYNNVQDITSAAKAHWEKADGVVGFVNYVEDIYVGYRFYETAAAEGAINYDETVQFPFGYGLSYTTFSKTMGDLNVGADGAVTVDVTVTNTGNTAGKDVIELYYNPPYTDGGIEKASANLLAFDKTTMLAPGESETLTLHFTLEDMASYDADKDKSYVLESGDYIVSLNSDSHTALDNRVYHQNETVVYGGSNPRKGDQTAAVNQFDFAKGDVEYLSRKNGFENYKSAVKAPTDYALHGEVTAHGTYDPTKYNNPADQMPKTEAKNGIKLYEMRGADYDDPKWETLLDQLSVDDMVNLIGFGGYGSIRVDSVRKLAALDADGPAGINARVSANSPSTKGTGYTSEIVIACTWNKDMALEAGKGLGAEARDLKVDGWYAPSMNLHRSAFEGRMFEYYSEDPVLSGEMAKAECEGAYTYNVYPFIKHFALNEQETNRNAILCTWTTEQAMRELYLKPFEECIKNRGNHTIAVMSSYNMIGTTWAAACPELLNTVLRDEWGYRGMVLSDYFGNYGYMDADKAVRGGNDMMLATAGNDAIMSDLSPTSVIAMRNACKNIMYTVVNSNTYADFDPNAIPSWVMTIYIIDGILVALLIAAEVLLVRNYRRKRNTVTVETVLKDH